MTEHGTFIINGAERVVVSQIIRSAGAYFTREFDKKTNELRYTAQIIPTRGAWVEYEANKSDVVFVKVDRSRRVPLTTFLRALGLSRNKDIIDLFGNSKYIRETFATDESKNSDEAVIKLYEKLRPDDKVPASVAREFLRMRLLMLEDMIFNQLVVIN